MLIKESLDLGIQKELKITPQSIKSQLKNEYNLAMPPQTDQKRGKPDLYVVAGFSGCGKSTFLNTALFSIDKIFSPKKTSLDILPIKTIEYFHARRRLWDTTDQAMLFCNAFSDITFLFKQEILPKQTLLHLDINHLLLSDDLKAFGIDRLEFKDLNSIRKVDQFLTDFIKIPFLISSTQFQLQLFKLTFTLIGLGTQEERQKNLILTQTWK